MTPGFPYVELPGTYRGFFRKASLWEGGDHVLAVKGTRFNEEYRRFYYRDIQAFIVEKRPRAGSLGWWTILLGLFAISLFAAAENSPPYSWVGSLALLVLIAMRLNLTFRRSCRFSIQTAVSREQLSSVLRRNAADAVVARLTLRIASEQGDLPADIPPVEEEVMAAIRPAGHSESAAAVLEEADRRERRRSAAKGFNLAVAALFLLLLNCVFVFWFAGKQVSAANTSWIGYSFIAFETGAIFLSLRHVAGIRIMNPLRYLLVAIVVFCFARFVIGLLMGPIYTSLTQTAGAAAAQGFTRNYNNVNGALQLAFAAGGLILILAKWETYRRGEPSSR